jgi:DNA polymerase delta subunit 1
MIRPTINHNTYKEDILCQIIDWKDFDMFDNVVSDDDEEQEEYDEDENPSFKKTYNKKLMIRGYGVTDKGNSICIHIENFQPYFFFKIPESWDDDDFKIFKNVVSSMIDKQHVNSLVKSGIIKKKEFYGFTNNELFKYGIFVLKNQSAYYAYKKLLSEKKIVIRLWEKKGYPYEFDFSNKLYETKVSSLLRFFHVQNLDPAGWLKIEASKYKRNIPSISRAQIDITVDFKNVIKIEKNDVGQIIVASFDIECCSEDGSFPKADRPNDPVIQIGTTVYIFGENECKLRYIATLNKCDPIEDTLVESFSNEKDLILGWASFISKLDPDIITGYNIWGFDWDYLYKRAETGNGGQILSYHELLFKKLQRINKCNAKATLTVQDLSSSALGVNILKYIDIEGIVQIDLYKVVQRDYKLDSFKLDNVAKTFMKQQKVDLSPRELFDNFKIGTPDKIKEIAVYCIMDCKLVNDLINRLQVITNNLGMANVCVVPFSYLFLRGQGIKIFSLVAKFCREENFLIKNLSPDDIDKNSYEGAIVFVPSPGIYFEPVVVMDYNSLYPSSMIAENISHDSILGYKEYGLKPKLKGDDKDEYELVKDTINEKYNNLEGYHYIDIEYDIFQGLDDDKKKVGYKVCKFAEANNGDKSVLPRILRKLLKARKDTRKIMEYKTFELKDGTCVEGIPDDKGDTYELFHVVKGKFSINKDDVLSSRKTNNEFQISVLDGLQLAYKVTCNSLYGQVGATTSPICYKELAACTTATGRKMVITARDLTLGTFEGCKLTYGDTDSIFVNFSDYIKKLYPDREFTEKELLQESIKIGELAAANINKHMKAPQNIEYEKTFWPFCIFSKKRYFGNKYEHSIEKYKETSMGIVLKRRDNAPIVKTIYGGIIDIILNKRNIEASKSFFYDSIKNLLNGKVDIGQLVISKSLKTDYANPNSIAHKVLADRMGERDPGNKPQSNDRIPYCYVDVSNLVCKICNKKVNPEQCKCISCMSLFCYFHLGNHRDVCINLCRFCKSSNKEKALTKCGTCNGWYCSKCNDRHKLRTDKYKVEHHDKCKKPLTPKLLQGDTIEHPLYIQEKKLKIDYNYYLTNQIQKPVYQIFELVMKKPETIIEDLVRDMNNSKNGNHTIKDWIKLMGKKTIVSSVAEISSEKPSLLDLINKELHEDEDKNLLEDIFEEDVIENLDDLTLVV